MCGAIVSVAIIFLVSAAETIGDTSALCATGLEREVSEKEISGSLACDGFASTLSGLFGCPPVTSFSQNIGLITMTKVVNRFAIMTGAVCMLLAGLFPPIGAFFASLPDAVLGGCTIMMFGSIMVSGVQMLARVGFNQRNTTIAALSLSVGIGLPLLQKLASGMYFHRLFRYIDRNRGSGLCSVHSSGFTVAKGYWKFINLVKSKRKASPKRGVLLLLLSITFFFFLLSDTVKIELPHLRLRQREKPVFHLLF